jgi:pre-mRNA-splicing factor ISY1
VLLKDEAEAEQQLQAAAIEQYETEQKLRELEGGGGTRKKASNVADAGRQFVAHVPLVDEADIEREVLNRKKQELLAKYVSEDLQAQEASAKTMLH